MAEGTFVTAINCMDGRTQQPVIDWMKKQYEVDYIDMITEPGPDGIMARREMDLVKQIKVRVMVSVEKHGSQAIALVAHGGCAGNPVSKDEHLGHLRKGMELIRSWELDVEIVGLWIDEENWVVDPIMFISKP
jgi:hypothetical protein